MKTNTLPPAKKRWRYIEWELSRVGDEFFRDYGEFRARREKNKWSRGPQCLVPTQGLSVQGCPATRSMIQINAAQQHPDTVVC